MNRAQRTLMAIEIAEQAVRQAKLNLRRSPELTEYDAEKILDELDNITRYLDRRASRIHRGEYERRKARGH